jgi:hypothetical protein
MPRDFILYEQDHRLSRDRHLVVFTNFPWFLTEKLGEFSQIFGGFSERYLLCFPRFSMDF